MDVSRKGVLITLGALALIVLGILLDPATVVEHVQSVIKSPWFPVVLAGLYLIRPFLGWPITGLSVLVGYKYGILLGVPVALLGAVVSTFIPFSAMRYLDFEWGPLEWAADESDDFFSETGGLRGVISARVAPFPAEATSIAAGTADVRPSSFVLGTAIGELPWAVAAVTIGHSMYRLSLSGVSFSPWLIAATLAAAVLLLAGPAHRFFTDDE
jgi:uncharacterized membrane protein YdjX (TVP38/TMEM64 family)